MTERERLIELLKKAPLCNRDFDLQYSDGTIEKFAEYLLENGVIVPPCKVGDTVYCEYNKKVIEGTVRLIRPFISANGVVFKGNLICEVDNPFLDNGTKEVIELYVVFDTSYEIKNGIDRIAYFTKEEAEQALKGAEGK